MKTYKRIRREESEQRNKLRTRLTNEEQLAILDSRLGKGVGAKKERKRLTNE